MTPQAPAVSAAPTRTYGVPGFVKIVAVVCLVFGIFCVLSGLLLLTQNDPGGTALLIVLGALLIGLFVWLRRRRVVLGPDGIDVRELLGSTHVPWPDSRGALIAFEGSRTSTRSTAVAQLRPADGSRPVRLGTITASAGDAQTAQLRVSEQLDDIWAWSTAMGYELSPR
ncbi:PH domain-containing protein [Actinomyces haliotis]|uniref:PH domain-containing protein n=1 Tax=Actinomyces haliotis TaxID=1280843 RepID=UPI00188E6696|nr:PH domain-containing protein [Actinomyces haliotis]